jgi:hypothetical protein
MWAFFQPLSLAVWLWMGLAVVLVPVFVVSFEIMFQTRCALVRS